MKISKIKSKYCTSNKVQMLFAKSLSDAICSKDGYLYIREGDIVINRYLIDPEKRKMPGSKKACIGKYTNHLFKYNQLYARFTCQKKREKDAPCTLSLLYFTRNRKNETVCTEFSLEDFEYKKEVLNNLTQKDVEKFLYETYGVSDKYIFDPSNGVMYANSLKEQISIDNGFVGFSDDEIVNRYNRTKCPDTTVLSYSEFRRAKERYDKEKASSIDEVNEFALTDNGSVSSGRPILLSVENDTMYVSLFKIIYHSKDNYSIKTINRVIKVDKRLIEKIDKVSLNDNIDVTFFSD